MHHLPQLILEAFQSHWPTLRDNPLELAARLQRRRRALLTRPPRAFCIALRSSDTRMTPWNTILDDARAIAHRRPHTVTIDAALIGRLCRPVYIQPPGELARDVAARLGVHVTGLRHLIHTGQFSARREKSAHGHGRPSPLIDCPRPLDPQSYGFRPPCPAWGEHWQFLARTFPADFTQPIRRCPEHRTGRWGTRFAGWLWRCPACEKPVPKLYFPLPTAHLLGDLASPPGLSDADAPLPPPPTFACGRCHRVTHLSRADKNGWNDLVTHLTAGLLYGREVPQTADWTARRNTKTRRPHARPAVRRAEVCRLLTETALTRAELATHLGLSRGTINMHVEDVFDQYGVHSREELRERVILGRRHKTENTRTQATRVAS